MSQPFMQLYVADYLGDTRHLTTEQHGAYLLLLMTMWRAGGRLPNEDKKLARITGCTSSRWAKIKAEVTEFFSVDGDEITHKRLMFELEKAQEKSIKRSVSGTQGGIAKSLKNKRPVVANASDLPWHSSEPESDSKKDKTTSYPKKRALKRCPDDWNPTEEDYAAGEPLSFSQMERELKKFRDYEFPKARSDWSATFRNWLRNAAERKPTNGTTVSPKLDHLDRVSAAMAAAGQWDTTERRGDSFDAEPSGGMPLLRSIS